MRKPSQKAILDTYSFSELLKLLQIKHDEEIFEEAEKHFTDEGQKNLKS